MQHREPREEMRPFPLETLALLLVGVGVLLPASHLRHLPAGCLRVGRRGLGGDTGLFPRRTAPEGRFEEALEPAGGTVASWAGSRPVSRFRG